MGHSDGGNCATAPRGDKRHWAEPKIFAPPQTPFPPEFNQLEMVTTFTYRPSLVKIDARNFELSW